jgi:phosphatidylglycerophosphate synthase
LSLREWRAVAQPPAYSMGPVDPAYRLVSIFLSVPLARTAATPNAITVAWIALGLAGAAAQVSGDGGVRVAGALLLQLSYLLDFVDGEVARLTGKKSLVGGFLDLVGHGLIKTALPLAVGAGVALARGEPGYLLAGAVGALALGIGDALRFYAACTAGDMGAGDLGHTVVPPPRRRRRVTPAALLRVAAEQSFESPGLYGLVLLAALAGRPDLLALGWLLAGPVWFLLRVRTYCRRLAATTP